MESWHRHQLTQTDLGIGFALCACAHRKRAKSSLSAQLDFSPQCLLSGISPAISHISLNTAQRLGRSFRTRVSTFSKSHAHGSDSQLRFIPKLLPNMLSKYLLCPAPSRHGGASPASHGAAWPSRCRSRDQASFRIFVSSSSSSF